MTRNFIIVLISAAVGVFVAAASASAQERSLPVDIDFLKMVNLPQEVPRITVVANDVVKNLRVTVREEGKTVTSKQFGQMGRGGNRTMTWRAEPGVHNYIIEVSGRTSEGQATVSQEAVITVMRPLEVSLARNLVDMEERRIPLTLNNPASRVEVVFYNAEGGSIYETNIDLNGKPAGSPIEITWPKLDEPVARIGLRLYDLSDSWVGMELLPFAVEIPHVDVQFETNKWDIRESEKSKLDDAYALLLKAIREHGSEIKARVYILGHTDTVGSYEDNMTLSRHRANAIAGYFKDKGGITLPILACGLGETMLAVKTGDNVDEPRNRRAQYLLAAQNPVNCDWTVVSAGSLK